VERPGLTEFLQSASSFCELSIFTAGLPEYAQPILAAIDPTGEFFGGRVVCRAGTSVAPEYPCVKDLSRLGRDLSRTLIVDDTPLAFLWQPANGVPVLGFRGDPDDNLLMDAVLPLIQLAAKEIDVRPFLDSRFGMATWFTSHGYMPHPPEPEPEPVGATSSSELCLSADSVGNSDSTKIALARAALSLTVRPASAGVPLNGSLLLCDFDKTLVDFDVTERVTEQLAIELVPFLAHFQAPGDFVPIMNSLLRELGMRGVSHAALLQALAGLGVEVPSQTVDMLHAAHKVGAAIRILSNCNSLFIENVLEVREQQPLLCIDAM
jgi:carboxy-terminal domain RNA polymerase II polypeptide A small phosphatase